jgi:hypothetical protein
MDTFIKWRNHNLNTMSKTCKMVGLFNMQGGDEIKHQIKIFPKCMVHLTKKMCKCDPKCISETFYGFNLDEKCLLFDLENVYTEDKYIEGCEKYDFWPINGKMVNRRVGRNVNEAKEEFYKAFNELCYDTTKVNETKSSAYELCDECCNSAECLLNTLDQGFKTNCTNEEYINQVSEIGKIFDIDLPVNKDSQPYRRRLSSTEDIPTASHFFNVEDYNILKINETDNSTNQGLELNANTSITFIGVVLISLLGIIKIV